MKSLRVLVLCVVFVSTFRTVGGHIAGDFYYFDYVDTGIRAELAGPGCKLILIKLKDIGVEALFGVVPMGPKSSRYLLARIREGDNPRQHFNAFHPNFVYVQPQYSTKPLPPGLFYALPPDRKKAVEEILAVNGAGVRHKIPLMMNRCEFEYFKTDDGKRYFFYYHPRKKLSDEQKTSHPKVINMAFERARGEWICQPRGVEISKESASSAFDHMTIEVLGAPAG